MATSSYRGHTSLAPVAPYAFTSTPGLNGGGNPLRQNPATPHLRQDNRTSSAPVIPNNITPNQGGGAHRPRYPASASLSTSSYPASASLSASSSSSSNHPAASQPTPSKDEPSLSTTARSVDAPTRPASTINLVTTTPPLPPSTLASPAKPSPDRYRRTQRRAEGHTPITSIQQPGLHGGSAFPSGSGMASVGHLYQHPTQSTSSPSLSTVQSYRRSPSPLGTASTGLSSVGQERVAGVDDKKTYAQAASEQSKRYHRRSVGSFDAGSNASAAEDWKNYTLYESKLGLTSDLNASRHDQKGMPGPSVTPLPPSSHSRNGSADSMTFGNPDQSPTSVSTVVIARGSRSRHCCRTTFAVRSLTMRFQAPRDAALGVVAPSATTIHSTPILKNEAKLVNIPPRGASDQSKRLPTPSPLSKPMDMRPQSPSFKDSVPPSPQPKGIEAPLASPHVTTAGQPDSPAAQQLAALNKKEGKKEGKSSRLRRAFSFGSAAELRRASAENNLNNNLSAERAKLRKERYHDEREAEQAAIAEKQEAAGLGEGIYSGQGHFFTGSTDNLSISSTASSASVMIRKMGKGMKKSTRSLVGLFRPKSVVGVPAADAALPEPSLAQVSMVTVEAEREKVNVNVDPHDQAGGGTGFPKLERNSLDAATAAVEDSRITDDGRSSENSQPRRSIVGGEKERAEVLAAVKKGILKSKSYS